ncbi:restriction endonuclease subunit S [Aeromonas sanarellii]
MSNWYPAYSEYNNSDVAWIEKYPSHWECSKVKYYLEKLIAGGTPESGNADYWIDSGEGTPWVSIADITLNPDVSTTKKDVTDAGIKAKNLKILPKGTVLYSIFASLGKVGEAKVRLTTNQAILGLVPTKKLNKELFKYWLHSVEAHLGLLSSSNTQDNLNAEKVGNLPILLPPAEEQQTIAAFLDYETARIDRLIAQQQRLIELLREKRQAVISHAVTKGLNPNAPMKDSGVEWLGQVPKHWSVSKVKYHASVKGRIGFRGYTTDDLVTNGEGALLIGATEMASSGEIELKSPQNISWEKYYESPEIMLEEGMILFVQRGSTVGKVAFVPNSLGKATINPSLIVLREVRILSRFLAYCLMSSPIQSLVKIQTSSTAIPMISQEQVGNYWQLVPTQEEQEEIVEFIRVKTGKVDQAINLSDININLLKERRTALISAAVTGKIDLRGWTPTAHEEAA